MTAHDAISVAWLSARRSASINRIAPTPRPARPRSTARRPNRVQGICPYLGSFRASSAGNSAAATVKAESVYRCSCRHPQRACPCLASTRCLARRRARRGRLVPAHGRGTPPRGQDVAGRIHVPIVSVTTLNAHPSPYSEHVQTCRSCQAIMKSVNDRPSSAAALSSNSFCSRVTRASRRSAGRRAFTGSAPSACPARHCRVRASRRECGSRARSSSC